MSTGYSVIEQTVHVGGHSWSLVTLADRQQYHDPGGHLEAAGIPPAMWSLFGVIWPSGIALAEFLIEFPVDHLRILEVGCGLGLASMVLHARGADVTASDMHPLAGEFLADNLQRNGLSPLPFEVLDWTTGAHHAHYDLIVGSDLLYERDQPASLAAFVDSHCAVPGEVILADPGRRQVGRFNRLMQDHGFSLAEQSRGKAKLVRYRRSTRDHKGARSTT
jgi:predicted nicotinamide N-methyase